MSSQPDIPASPRHSYDSLFGDGPEGYDAPVGDAEPYLPPNAPENRRSDANPPAAATGAAPAAVPARESKPARQVDTGRLYHSAGAAAAAATGALPALREARPDRGASASAAAPAPPSTAADAAAADAAAVETPEPAPTRFEGVAPGPGGPAPAGNSASSWADNSAGAAAATDARGLTYLGVAVVVGAPTLLVGLAQAIISNRIGWLTGLVLLVTSCYAALSVRASDRSAAIVVPPLAFLVTTLVAGQLTLAEGGSFLVREGFMIFRTLAENAPWVLGATAVAAAIVVLRKRRASRAG